MISLLHDLLLHSAREFPENECIIHNTRVLTFSGLREEVFKLAHALVQLGVSPGDRVAIHLEKSIEEVTAILAISMAGGVSVNINSLLKARQVNHILGDCGAEILITSYPRLKTLGMDLIGTGKLRTIVVCGNTTPINEPLLNKITTHETVLQSFQVVDISFIENGRQNTPLPSRIDSDIAAIIYTSGSTGMPKGVVLTHRNLVAGARSVSSYLKNTCRDRILSILPFSFDYGLNQLTTALLMGAALVLKNYLAPGEILNSLEKDQITGLAGIPTLWSQLLQLDWSGRRFPSLRYITNSGGRFAEHLVKEYRLRLPNTSIFLMYGLTEAFRSTYLEPDQVDTRPTSIGKAIPNAEIMVIDEHGRCCGPNEVGELVHRGVHVALGYWNDPVLTRQRFRRNPIQPAELQTDELVVFSGDLVRRDEAGYLYFLGRKDHMIKTSGFRVSPTEVEEYFYSTGLVQDVVAFGVPDPLRGEAIQVVLSLKKETNISSAEILSRVSRRMPSFMVPKGIHILEKLPKNSTGKLDRPLICSLATTSQMQMTQTA